MILRKKTPHQLLLHAGTFVHLLYVSPNPHGATEFGLRKTATGKEW